MHAVTTLYSCNPLACLRDVSSACVLGLTTDFANRQELSARTFCAGSGVADENTLQHRLKHRAYVDRLRESC